VQRYNLEPELRFNPTHLEYTKATIFFNMKEVITTTPISPQLAVTSVTGMSDLPKQRQKSGCMVKIAPSQWKLLLHLGI